MAYKNGEGKFEKRKFNIKTIWVQRKFIRGSVIDLNCVLVHSNALIYMYVTRLVKVRDFQQYIHPAMA